MLLFRSEEHLDRWLADTGHPRGASFSIQTCWDLARAWYADKGKPTYRRKTVDEANATFESLGLTGDFWLL
jgi:hypothetical protein